MIVAAALFVQNGKILIARRSDDRHLAGHWEFPGGKAEPGETPEACLDREIREELGIEIEVGSLFAKNVHRYDSKTIELLVYRARPLSESYALSAHSEIRWVSAGELLGFDLAPADVPIARRIAEEGVLAR